MTKREEFEAALLLFGGACAGVVRNALDKTASRAIKDSTNAEQDAARLRVLALYDEAEKRVADLELDWNESQNEINSLAAKLDQQPWADEAELAEALRGVFGEFVDNGGNACEAWLACARVALLAAYEAKRNRADALAAELAEVEMMERGRAEIAAGNSVRLEDLKITDAMVEAAREALEIQWGTLFIMGDVVDPNTINIRAILDAALAPPKEIP